MSGHFHANRPPPRAAARLPASILIIALCSLLQTVLAQQAPGAAPPGNSKVEVHAGRLSVALDDAPLAEVLRLVAARSGVEVVLFGHFDERVSLAFSSLPLDRGIKRLVRRASLVMVYRPAEGSDAAPTLAEVRVYAAADSSRVTRHAPAGAKVDLKSHRAAERIRIIRGLGHRGNDAELGILGDVLLNDKAAAVRVQAVDALRRIGGDGAVESLALGLDDESRSVRKRIVTALGSIGGVRATAVLGEVMLEDADPQLRIAATYRLARLGTPEAIEYLQSAARDEHQGVRFAAQSVLSGIR